MSYVIISNIPVDGLEPLDFYKNEDYRKFGVSSGSSTLVPVYKEYLSQIIGDKINSIIKDRTFTSVETEAIKDLFQSLLEEKLEQWERAKVPTTEVEIFGKTYLLDLRLTSPDDRIINDYNTIYTIANECLRDDKSMYLSIE